MNDFENTQTNDRKKAYFKAKANLVDFENRKKSRKRRYYIFSILASIIICLLFYYIDQPFKYSDNDSNITLFIILLLFSVIFGLLIATYFCMTLDIKESQLKKGVLEYELENIKEDVKTDIFENSIEMSYKYLDQYYLQTREQAQKGFLVTICVAVFGALLIGIGIIALFFDKVEPSYISCASGVLTEFIASVFFYLYNKTVSSMSKYHNKLVLSQNISIALKIAESLPTEDRAKTKNYIISELLKDINTYLVKNDENNK